MNTGLNSSPDAAREESSQHGAIQTRQCGKYDLELPILGMGCWAYGGGEYWGAHNELPYSLLTRAIELEILPKCRRLGVGVLGYMSLLQGVLADIYPTLDDVPVWQRRTRHFDSRRTAHTRHGLPGAEAETNAALASIRAIARKHGATMPELDRSIP